LIPWRIQFASVTRYGSEGEAGRLTSDDLDEVDAGGRSPVTRHLSDEREDAG